MAVNKNRTNALGVRLRRLRKQKGWTLAQVASNSGLAISTLSKVENGQISLTYDNLLKLAEGLGVNISELFASKDSTSISGRRTITRKGEAKIVETPNYQYHYHSTDMLDIRVIPMVVVVKARSREEFGELLRHSGEEFVFVIEGIVEVHTDFYEPVRLGPGESIYLDSKMGHCSINVGEGDAKVLCVCSNPFTVGDH